VVTSYRISERSIAQRHLQLLIALCTLALSAACTDTLSQSDNDSSADTTADASSEAFPVPEEIEDPQAAAVAAYERYWRTVADATTIPDPDYPELSEVAADQALEWARSLVQGGVEEGHRGTGYPSHEAEVTDIHPAADPTELAVADCMDDTDWLVLEAESGELVSGEVYGTSKVSALVERIDDRWLVTEIIQQRIGSCLGSSAPGLRSSWG
jgi:hypothetical protein